MPVSDSDIHLASLGNFIHALIICDAEEFGGIDLVREHAFEVRRQTKIPNVFSLILLDL